MMKKLLILTIIATLTLALSLSAAAGPFPDVEADHWAYDAVSRAVTSDVIEGMPDGTFRGDDNVTRYQLAMVIDRLLDEMDDMTVQELRNELRSLRTRFDVAVEDITAVPGLKDDISELEAIIDELEEDTADLSRMRVTLDMLQTRLDLIASELEAIPDIESDVADLGEDVDEIKDDLGVLSQMEIDLDALTTRFNMAIEDIVKIPDIEEDVDALRDDVDVLRGDVDDLQVVTISGTSGLDLSHFEITEPGDDAVPTITPYTLHPPAAHLVDEGDEETTLEHTLDLGMNITPSDEVTVDVNLTLLQDIMGNSNLDNLEFQNMSFTAESPVVDIRAQNNLFHGYTHYFYSAPAWAARTDGIEVQFKEYDLFTALGMEGNDYRYMLQHDRDFLGIDTEITVAGEVVTDIVDWDGVDSIETDFGTQFVGLDMGTELAGFDTSLEYVTDLDLEEDNTLMTLGVAGDLGPASVDFNYKDVKSDFQTMLGAVALHNPANINYDKWTTGLGAGIQGYNATIGAELAGIDTTLFMASIMPDQEIDETDTRMSVSGSTSITDDLTLTGSYRTDTEESLAEETNATAVGVSYTELIDGLNLDVDYDREDVVDTGTDDQDITDTTEIGLAYTAIEDLALGFDYGMQTPVESSVGLEDVEVSMALDASYDILDDLSLSLNYEDITNWDMVDDYYSNTIGYGLSLANYDLMDNISVRAAVDMEMMEGRGVAGDIVEDTTSFSLGSTYDISERLQFVADYQQVSKSGQNYFVLGAHTWEAFGEESTYTQKDLGINYNILEDTDLSIGATLTDFVSDNEDLDYGIVEANAGLSIAF